MARISCAVLIALMLLSNPVAVFAQDPDPQTTASGRPVIDGKRVALVIGNSNYLEDQYWRQLDNAALDAAAIAHQLRNPVGGAGRFDVMLLIDADAEEMRAGIERFAAFAQEADVALVYYSGHGFMYNLKNYIVPVDAPRTVSDLSVDRFHVDMSEVIAAGQSKGISLFFLDACRTTDALRDTGVDNQSRGPTSFGTVKARGSAVFYSTSDREPAYDAVPAGTQRSPFARAVLDALQKPGIEFSVFSKDVTAAVFRQTSGLSPDQYPYLGSQMFQDFYFLPYREVGYTRAGDVPASTAPTREVDWEAYEKCMRGELVVDRVAVERSACGRLFSLEDDAAPQAANVMVSGPAILIGLPTLTPLDIAAELIDRSDDELLILDILDDYSPARLLALSDQGDPVAAYILGQMYFDGIGVVRDFKAAGEQFEKAAASGHPAGQYGLGRYLERMIFEYNEPVEDGGRITDLYRASFAQGFGTAGVRLANLYAEGLIALPDDNRDENIEIWKTMAERGHAGSRFELVVRNIDADTQFAALKGDAQNDNGEAALWLCRLDDDRQALRERFDHCVFAASRGHEMAVVTMATDLYSRKGLDLSPTDLAYWSRLALGSPLLPDQWLPCVEAIADTGQITDACDLSGKGP